MRFATYNIRHAQGIDGFILPNRIARVLADVDADVIGMQEVWNIPGRQDQTRRIAERLEMGHHFSVAECRGPLEMGNSVLTDHDLVRVDTITLPRRQEGRVCVLTELDCEGFRFRFAVTHLALHKETRAAAIELLARELPRDLPLVLVGDFNADTVELEPLREWLTAPDPPATFPSPVPRTSLDHIAFSTGHWELEEMGTVSSWASDHLPLYADLEPVVP